MSLIPGSLLTSLAVPVKVPSIGQRDVFEKLFLFYETMCKIVSDERTTQKHNYERAMNTIFWHLRIKLLELLNQPFHKIAHALSKNTASIIYKKEYAFHCWLIE